MTAHVYSIVGLIPATDRQDANLLACAIGHDVYPGNTFVVPLSADGSAPASHYGYHAVATAVFAGQISAAQTGVWPEGADFGAVGLTEARGNELIAAMTLSAKLRSVQEGSAHFDAVIGAAGLQRIIDDE